MHYTFQIDHVTYDPSVTYVKKTRVSTISYWLWFALVFFIVFIGGLIFLIKLGV